MTQICLNDLGQTFEDSEDTSIKDKLLHNLSSSTQFDLMIWVRTSKTQQILLLKISYFMICLHQPNLTSMIWLRTSKTPKILTSNLINFTICRNDFSHHFEYQFLPSQRSANYLDRCKWVSMAEMDILGIVPRLPSEAHWSSSILLGKPPGFAAGGFILHGLGR